jgi:DNA-directed RNA polymerase I subunit RPA43
MAAATADEPTVPVEEQPGKESEEAAEAMEDQLGKESEEAAEAMKEQLGKESEEATESAEAMKEQLGKESEEATESAEAMEQIEEEPEEGGDPAEAMEKAGVEAEAEAEEGASLRPALPVGRVKRIMRVDRDIKKVTSEAALLIAAATELFLGSLATGAHTAAARRGRRTVRAVHVRAAARAHRPTADFLLDCLAAEEEVPRARKTAGSAGGGGGGEAKPLPRGTRRIDAFFQKVT